MSAAIASGVVPSGGRVWWEDHLAREDDWAWCWSSYWWERDAGATA